MRDMDAADAAGIAFGGVAWGYADPDALRARDPHAWFDTVADIPRVLTAGYAIARDVAEPMTAGETAT